VATRGSPSESVLSGYGRVIWSTGDDYLTTLTQLEQESLAAYLEEGGRLLLSGQYIAYDIDDSVFFQHYLHAVYVTDNRTIRSLIGEDFLSGASLTISGGTGANNQKYPADITPDGSAFPVLNYTSLYHQGGIAYQNGTYKLVFFSFGFEAISSASTRNEVMLKTLSWLGGIKSDLSITKSDDLDSVFPGDSLIYTIVVHNLGPMASDGIGVKDIFPEYLQQVSWTCSASSGSSCSTPGGSGNIELSGNLSAGGSITLIASALVSQEAAGVLTNTAAVSFPAGGEDPDLFNNEDTDIDVIYSYLLHLPAIYRP
jgi:uncharacterized repeat protein (TIGR01451 family)